MNPGPEGNEGPLRGVRVVELGSLIAGPFCGRILADFGAQVVKVEPPGQGDPLREWGLVTEHGSLWSMVQSRNKKSIVLDLRTDSGRELVKRLIAESDVVIESFRPGRMEEWGLDYATLSKDRPHLVMVRVSGFGQTGPYSQRPGFGNVAESMGGLRYITGFPDRPPLRVGMSLADHIAALYAVIGALSALQARERTGEGQVGRGAHGRRGGAGPGSSRGAARADLQHQGHRRGPPVPGARHDPPRAARALRRGGHARRRADLLRHTQRRA